MDFKNILEGTRPFFQGLPQPLGEQSPAETESSVPINTKEKEVIPNHLSHSHYRQLYHSGVIANHSSGSVVAGNVNSNGNNSTHYSSSSSGNNNNISKHNNKESSVADDSVASAVIDKTSHTTNNSSHSVSGSGQKGSNTSGKSGNSSVPTHPLLQGGFGIGNSLPHPNRSSQSHVPLHVPLTLPLPNHQQERPLPRSKYDEGLGAALSQMYAETISGSRGPSQSRHVNGASAGLLQTVAPVNTNHGTSSNTNSGSNNSVSSGTVSNSMGGTTVRRESPLDLSVKTVRQSADSSTPLEAPAPSSGINGNIGGTRAFTGSGASTPNLIMPTVNQHHYPLHSTLSDGSSNVTSATGSSRQMTVGDSVNSVVAAVVNSTTGVGLSSNESRSSSGKSGRGRSREKSHERETSSSRSRTSTPTGNGGALRYPSPAHLHRQQSPSGTASPHMHQRVASLQLNIPNPTPPPRTASGSSVNSVGASYNPSSTPQPAGTPAGATQTSHHLFPQHSYAPSSVPQGVGGPGKVISPSVGGSYHSHYPGVPPASHHPSPANSSNSGSQHVSNNQPSATAGVPPTSTSTTAPNSHHAQPPKHSSAIPPYNPPPPSFGTSLNPGYPPPSAHHHSYPQYHQYQAHHASTPTHSVPPQSPAPLSHHPHHPYYPVYGHHSHLQQPPQVVPHQRSSSVAPSPSTPASTSQHGVAPAPSPAPAANCSTPTPSVHPSQYLQPKHPGYTYPPSTQSQSSQPAPTATPTYYHHSTPPASSYYGTQHQTQHPPVSSHVQPPARPAPATNQHHTPLPGYPSSHYGHPQNQTAATPYSHAPQHMYPTSMTPLTYPTYVPQAQRTQQQAPGAYPPQSYAPQSSYYQGPPGLRPSTPTGPPPPPQQTTAGTPYPPTGQASGTATPTVATNKDLPSTAEGLNSLASDMKPPQNPSTSGKSPKSGNSRKNLLHMLRNSVENRMHEKQDKDKFQFNHQTWNFHGRKYNTTLPPLNSSNANGGSGGGQTTSSGVASPGGTSYAHLVNRPTSPNSTNSLSAESQKGLATNAKYDNSSQYGGGSSASSTYGTNASSESSSTSGIGSFSDSSQFHRIRTKAEKKQLFPNLLSQFEQENSQKDSEKLQQQQLGQSGNFLPPGSAGGPSVRSGTSANALSNSSKIKFSNSTSVFDFQEDEEDMMGSKGVPPPPPPPVTVVPDVKPPKKPRSPKKAAEPGARRNSLPKVKGQASTKKVKQTPQQQQELMAAVIASVAASSTQNAAAAEAHQKYIESLKTKDLTSKELSMSTQLKIPNPAGVLRDSETTPVLEKDGTTKPAVEATAGKSSDSKSEMKPVASSSSKATASSTALESMDAFWDVCDSFATDLQSNPQTIKSRRFLQKLKSKPKPADGNGGEESAAKIRKGRVGPRIKKNSSEEDSDFEVEKSSDEDEDEDDEEEDSEQSDKSESDDTNSASVSRKGSNSGDSSGIQRRKGLKKKTKRIIESEEEDDDDNEKEAKEGKASGDEKSSKGKRKPSRSLSSKKRSVSKTTSKADSSDVDTKTSSTKRRASKKGKSETSRSRSSRRPVRKSKSGLRRKPGLASLSDLDEDEDATSRTSIGSESDDDGSDDSDSEVSSFDDSSMSDDSDSNGGSDDSDSNSDEDFDGQSFSSSRKRKKTTTGGKKAKRARLRKSGKGKGKGRKSRKSARKSESETKRTRSNSAKNGKQESRSTSTSGKKDKENIQDSDFSEDESSVDVKRSRGLRSRSRGQKQDKKSGARKLRPKRNCAPAPGNGKLKDISESEDEEGGSSGEEWIMRTELGKKKRRIVFGDGSEFQRPGWEEELIDFKKKLRMPHKLIRVAKPSSLSLSPSGNGAQSAASSVTGGIIESGISPAKSTKENKSPHTPVKGSKQQHRREKSPEKDKDLPDLIREKPKETKERKGKGRSSKTTSSATTPVPTPTKADASNTKGKEKEPTEKEKPSKGKGKGAKSKVTVEKKPDNSESSLDEPAIERAVEQMKAATKRDSKIGSNNNVSATVKATIDAVVKFSEKKDDTNSEKDKKSPATPKPSSSSSVAGVETETSPLPSTEVPSPSSSTSAATPTTVAKKALRRKKFKSGFDYIRKKKKATDTDGSAAAPPPKRVKSTAEKNTNVEDIQSEVRGWVLNKGLGETALHRAARLGYPDVATWCLETDYCQSNCKDNAGYTPLHETCIKGNLEVARVLLTYGANPSQAAPGGIRPLHEACENGHVELVRLLISFGADPTVATYGGQTPLELAENHEPVRLLLQQHINDVLGREDKYWEFRGSGNWAEEPFDNGFDVTDDPPQADSDVEDMDGFEFESSEKPLPHLYRLKDHTAQYILLNEVLSYLGLPKDRVMKNLPGADIVELNSNDFLEQAHCCQLLGEKITFNAISELTLIKYDDRIKKMLGVESYRIK